MHFLVVRLSALGDIAVTTPVLARIRAEHPGARVTWLCGAGALPLVSLFTGVDEILTIDEWKLLRGNVIERIAAVFRLWKQLLARRFDRVLLYHADKRYRVLTLPLIGTRIDALHHRPDPRANPLPGRFRGDECARLLDGEMSSGPITKRYPLADIRDHLPGHERREADGPTRVGLVPGGARNVLADDALRRWPIESYVRLAEGLLDSGCEVVLLGDAGDRAFGQRFKHLNVNDRIGQTTLVGMLEAMSDMDVVVTHDTGPLHLARLVRTPVVGLFGPTDPRQVVGEDAAVTALWGGAHLPCRPCYDGRTYARCSDNVCLRSVSVATVLRAVLNRVGSPESRGARAALDVLPT